MGVHKSFINEITAMFDLAGIPYNSSTSAFTPVHAYHFEKYRLHVDMLNYTYTLAEAFPPYYKAIKTGEATLENIQDVILTYLINKE